MKKKISKIILGIGIVILVFIVFIFLLGLYGNRVQNYFLKQRQEKFLMELEQKKAEILEMQKNDTYGGKTPEETLDLYISALKAGDIDLASKYSEISLEKPNLQTEDLLRLKKVLERDGNLDIVLNNMSSIIEKGKKNVWSDTKVSFVYEYVSISESTSTSIISGQEVLTVRPKGTKENMGISLRQNPYTGVWKIIQ